MFIEFELNQPKAKLKKTQPKKTHPKCVYNNIL